MRIARSVMLTALALSLMVSVIPAQADYATLRPGDDCAAVRQMQQALRGWGYPIGADGRYGAVTEAAVRSFQARQGIRQDGVAGAQTLSMLYNGTPTPLPSAPDASGQPVPPVPEQPSAPIGRLELGSQGEQVQNLQQKLANLGYHSGRTDGVFDEATRRAVIAFQAAQGLKQDGIAGTRTLGSLYAAPAAPVGGTVPAPESPLAPAVTAVNTGATVVNSRALRIRSQPDSSRNNVVAVLKSGDKVQVSGQQGEWSQVSWYKYHGFVMTKFLKLDRPPEPDPAEVPPEAPADGAAQPGDSALRMGSQDGADRAVSAMQQRLKDLGYSLAVDGSFGPGTHAQVVRFQQSNGLSPSGVADAGTLSVLYAAGAKGPEKASGAVDLSSARGGGPSASSVKLMDWYSEVKPKLRGGQSVQVYHPASGVTFDVQMYSLGRHADAEPRTLRDTQVMNEAFGRTSWDTRPVYVKLPTGEWTLGTMHNYPHLSGSIKDNGFGGHLCIHFKRDMDETKSVDPNYGMQNQRTIRKAWQSMTGEVVN